MEQICEVKRSRAAMSICLSTAKDHTAGAGEEWMVFGLNTARRQSVLGPEVL